jgi:oleandomycin transport system ATP-binding protein
MTHTIEAEGLTKRFGATQALDGVNLAAAEGTVLGVLGPNGAGKTTAVRILATLLRPDSGRATVAGYDVVRDASKVRRVVGLTGQCASVDEDLTGTQNLVMIGQLLNLTTRDARARSAELLEWFDLSEAAGRVAKTCSGGMRRRLDLAASLVGRPRVIFLDEPTTGLDPAKREDMWDVVRRLVTDGSTVLLTTQYLDEADALADQITVIDRGRVIANNSPEGLKRTIGGQRIRVKPADRSRLDDVRRILGTIAPQADQVTGRDEITVPVDGEQALAATVASLTAEGIAVTELSLHLPSLDEVFLTLTGQHIDERPPLTAVVTPAPTTTARARRSRQQHDSSTYRNGRRSGAGPAPPPRPHRNGEQLLAGRLPPARLRAGQAESDQDLAHAGGADRRHRATDHLPGAVHVHLRRRDRRYLPGLPAVPVARPARPVPSRWPGWRWARTSTPTSRRASSTGSGRCRSVDRCHWSAQ